MSVSFGPPTPMLRSFDETKAREFYLDFLGFTVDFEHRFGPNAPLYLGVSFGACKLHLTEHHGDAAPGSSLRIEVENLSEYVHGLRDKKYKYSGAGEPEERPWGTREITIADPFGNHLTFFETIAP